MSDDFIALHYARDITRAIADFAGNQYDLPGMVWFYRPLITMSFWLDVQIGGGDPFTAHFSNALIHAINALLLARICRLYLGPLKAFACGLLWGLSPSHIAAIQWAAGRVDTHATVWILLTCWCMQRWSLGQGRRVAGLCFFVLALMSKESALIAPGLVAVIVFTSAGEGRTRRTLQAIWPMALILCAYLAWRWFLFGRLGGYENPWPGAREVLAGLGQSSLNLCNPLSYAGQGYHPLAAQLWPLGFLPVGIGITVLLLRRKLSVLASITLLYLCACIPIAQLLPGFENLHDLRRFYLPSMALLALIAASGPIATLLGLLVFALPMLEMRADFSQQFAANQRTHGLVLEAKEHSDSDLLFISGLRRQNRKNTALAFHLGIDRLLLPPFANRDTRLFALRPLAQVAGANRLPYGEQRGLPFGSNFSIVGESILVSLPRPGLPDIHLQLEGSDLLSTERLRRLNDGIGSCQLRILDQRSTHYRVTLFTAGGYLSCIREDAGPADAKDGRIDLFAMLRDGTISPDRTRILWRALRIPLTLDLDLNLPVLVEAGSMEETPAGMIFSATHANRVPLWLRFDRDYVEGLTGG